MKKCEWNDYKLADKIEANIKQTHYENLYAYLHWFI